MKEAVKEAVKEARSLGMVAWRPWGQAWRLLSPLPGLWAGRDGARGGGRRLNTTEFLLTAWTVGLENALRTFPVV